MRRWFEFPARSIVVCRARHTPTQSSSEEDLPPLEFSSVVASHGNLPSSNVGSRGYQPPLQENSENVSVSVEVQPGRLASLWSRVSSLTRYLGRSSQSVCSSRERALHVDEDPLADALTRGHLKARAAVAEGPGAGS